MQLLKSLNKVGGYRCLSGDSLVMVVEGWEGLGEEFLIFHIVSPLTNIIINLQIVYENDECTTKVGPWSAM